MYILTSLAIENAEDAWEICFSYIHRWNIEQTFRFAKSELAMESPRLWSFENRLKLLAIVVNGLVISLTVTQLIFIRQLMQRYSNVIDYLSKD